MKRVLSIVLLGLMGVGTMVGCEASAKVDTDGDVDNGTYRRTTVKRETPSGDTTYERKTETKTTVR
jgi:hypothetical protein